MSIENKVDRVTYIQRIIQHLANASADVSLYSNWTDKFCRKHISDAYKKVPVHLAKEGISLYDLTDDELAEVGFKMWSKESSVRLTPAWAYHAFQDGDEIVDISGGTRKFKHGTTDDDQRFGCFGWGIIPSDKKKEHLINTLKHQGEPETYGEEKSEAVSPAKDPRDAR